MKKKPVIGLDLDGVIFDHSHNKMRLSHDFGYPVRREETATDIFKHKIPEGVYQKIQEIIYDDPIVGLTPILLEGAREGLKELTSSAINFYLISRRKSGDVALKLLKKKGLWPHYFNEKNTFFVKTKEEKNSKAKELSIGFYLDDQPSVLEKLVDVPSLFLMDQFRVYPSGQNYKKIHSWAEFLEAIQN